MLNFKWTKLLASVMEHSHSLSADGSKTLTLLLVNEMRVNVKDRTWEVRRMIVTHVQPEDPSAYIRPKVADAGTNVAKTSPPPPHSLAPHPLSLSLHSSSGARRHCVDARLGNGSTVKIASIGADREGIAYRYVTTGPL